VSPPSAMLRGMAYDEDLTDRLREALQDVEGVTEKKMFGGLAFLVGGNLAVAASGQGGLMLRCDPARSDELTSEHGVTRMVMRGREMDGWLRVAEGAVQADEDMARWVEVGVGYASSLPSK
jgi:TfoX/Sxy family transcriptional regulator of competence genes